MSLLSDTSDKSDKNTPKLPRELRVLAAALLLAVAGVGAVALFTGRIETAMHEQSAELLAADLLLASQHGIAPHWRQRAEKLSLQTTLTTEFRSMVLRNDLFVLAEIKAVEPGYPLRGVLRIANDLTEPDVEAGGQIPAPGEAWLDERLMQQLQAKRGDSLTLGTLTLRIGRILRYEPDRAGAFFSIAPRLLCNRSDLPASGLLGLGALKQENLLLAGEADALADFQLWLAPHLTSAETVRTGSDGRPELRTAFERADRFLGLAALAAVLLAGVAVAMAADHYARRRFDEVAILRCLGASRRVIFWRYLRPILRVAWLATLAGAVLALLAEEGLSALMAGLFRQQLPQVSWQPLGYGLLVGWITLVGFALPPLLALRQVPPLRVLRRDIPGGEATAWLLYLLALATLLLLMAMQVRDATLTGWLLLGTVTTAALLALAALALIKLCAMWRLRTDGFWRFGLANIARRPGASVAQVSALGLGIMVLLLLTFVRSDLLADWQATLPPDAPNRFMIDVQPDQVEPLRHLLAKEGLTPPSFFPMIKGRLVAINGREISEANYSDERAQHLVKREFNLSWATTLGADNKIEQGGWFNAGDGANGDGANPAQWSVEQGLAETLGLHLGDRLRYQIADHAVEGTITSLRSVKWDSFRVNFFVVAPLELLKNEQGSYITSFYLPPEQRAVMGELVRQFPNVTVLDVDSLMQRVRDLIGRVSRAVEFVFLFTLAAGMVVLWAALEAARGERQRETALLRTLGASRQQVRTALFVEFATLGLLAGVLAACGATLTGWLLATQAFKVPYHFNGLIWLAAVVVGAVGVSLLGWLSTRRVLNLPPLATLRGE